MKENDWIIANINNPDFTASDFKNIGGLSLENTQLLPVDSYLNNDKVRNNDLFKDSSGQFNKDIFKSYYNNLAEKFSNFSEESSLDNYEYGFWDVFLKPDSKVRNPNFKIEKMPNPTHQSYGVLGLNVQGERTKSDLELAEQLKIYDFTNKKQLDYSANDIALFSNPIKFFKELFSEPVVLATYDKDEDSINPLTGLMEHHVKGEKKLNAAGEYYLETLGNRSILGKTVLSLGDIITSDTSSLNKYDFFDSDGLDKNPIGTITKNLAAVAPMVFLGPTGSAIYGGLYVLREMSKTLPMLQGMLSLVGSDMDNLLILTIAAYGEKYTGGTSTYAKENTFSFENFGNLVSDVALLWSLQKFIANSIAKLGGSSELVIKAAKGKAMHEYEKQALNLLNRAEAGEQLLVIAYTGQLTRAGIKDALKNNSWEKSIIGLAALNKYLPEALKAYAKRLRLGLDLSLAYMALISNTDVYSSALEHGASKKEAAAMALGSTLGMFGVDKYLGLGEMFFDDPDAVARRTFKAALRQEADALNSKIGTLAQITEKESPKKYLGFISRGIKAALNTIAKYHGDIKDRALGIVGKSLGEGLEEVSEELVTDIIKSLYELAGSFGYTSTKDVGAWENAKERYLMSFFGGAIGGAMFGGIESIKNPSSAFDKNNQKELLYLIKEGKTKDILRQLDNLHEKGLLGNKNLSIDSENGTFISSDENHKSLNDFVYDIMKSSILLMDAIINGNLLNISDNDLFERMVISDPKFTSLKDVLLENSYITGYYNEYLNLVNEFYNIEKDIKNLETNNSDAEKRKSLDYINQMLELLDKRNETKEKIENFKAGKYSLEYVEKMLFAMNPEISGTFLSMNFAQYVRNNYNKDVSLLSTAEYESYLKEWEKYNKSRRKLDFDEAYKLYKEVSKKINPILLELSKSSDLKSWENVILNLEKTFPSNFIKTVDDIKDSELGDISELSSEEILNRKKEIADEYNNENISKLILNFADNNSIIDTTTYRRLMSLLDTRRKDVVTSEINLRIKFKTSNGNDLDEATSNKFLNILADLSDDFSNLSDIQNRIKEIVKDFVHKHTEYNNAILGNEIDGKGYYTFTDLLDIINESFKNKLISEEDIDNIFEGELNDAYFLEDLINSHNLEITPSQENALKLSELISKYNENSYSENGLLLAVVIGANKLNEIENSLIEEASKNINDNINIVISKIQANPFYKALTDVKKKLTFDNNPTLKLIKEIATKLGDNFSDIENTLQSIYELYERLLDILDYLLSDELIQALLQALRYIDIAEGFINASSRESSYFHIMPFYKTINEFNKNHKEVLESTIEELPELDIDIANVSILSLNNYRREINSWIDKSQRNSLNKIKEFKDFKRKFSNILVSFLKDNFTEDGFGLDLIEGIELIDLESPTVLFELEKLLHYNFIKSGKNAKELIPVFKRVIKNYGDKDFIKLTTSELNGNISPDKFTAYDKFTYLCSIFAEDPIDFYRDYKDFIENRAINKDGEKIAPLTFLEHAIRLAHALENNPDLIDNILEEVSKDLKLEIPLLKHTSIITGLGGAGKSLVTARALVNSNSVWFSGPSDTLISGLLSINENGRGLSKEELFNEILESGEYNALLSEMASNEPKTGSKIRITKTTIGNYVTLKNIKYKKPTSVPEKIIIDEATLFNLAELLILGEWAKKFGSRIVLLGDENLNGNLQAGQNLAPEFMFAFRTPRLSISLRLANYWKYINQKPLENFLNLFRAADTEDKVKLLAKQFLEKDFKEYKFHYYFQNGVFTGDMLANELTEDILNSLGNAEIGYVGDKNTPTYLKLKDSEKKIIVLNPQQVQGLEFDYVIVDKDWSTLPENGTKLFNYLLDLYTMITRSRKGTIIINNSLSEIIGENKEENYTTDAITLNPQAIEEFTKSELDYLNSLDLTPRTIEISTEKKSIPLEVDVPANVPPLPEEIGQLLNSTYLRDEENVSSNINPEPIMENPFTVFGNIGFTGLTIEELNKKEIWKSNGSLRDLDILLSEEAQEYFPKANRKTALTTAKDLIDYTEKLIKLRGFIQFRNTDYHSLPSIITNLFTEKDFDNIQYYIVSEDLDDSKHTLLRILQNLSEDERSFISSVSGKKLVLSLLGRIIKNGKTYIITLGALQSLQNSKNTINILMDLLHREHPELNDTDLLKAALNIITTYERLIKEFVQNGNNERRISTPYFTKTTGLRKIEKKYRILDITLRGKKSKFEKATTGFISSPIYTIIDTEEITKLQLSPNLVGKPIMYVSANPNLNPLDLATLYAKQKTDPNNHTPEVRCVVLNTEGVSFESMLRPAYTRNHYETKVSNKKTFHLPFVALPMGVRMYMALWNFRANLINFNKAVLDEFENEIELADELALLDSSLYRLAKESNGGKYLNLEEYRKWVASTLTEEILNKIKRIWAFNDKLTDNQIKEFRLGYSSESGAYVRKISDSENVIYINRELAEQYESAIRNLFSNIIDAKEDGSNGLIPPISLNINLFIDRKASVETWKKMNLDWVQKVLEGGSLEVSTSEGVVDFNFGASERISMLPTVLRLIGINLLSRQQDIIQFDLEYSDGKHQIKVGKVPLNYLSLILGIFKDIEILEYGVVDNKPIGTEAFNLETGEGIVDKRLINMFNLAFHGIPHTREFNDLNTPGLLKATEALFPNGFFVDTFISADHTNNVNKEVLTDKSFYSTDVVPTGPTIRISLDEYAPEIKEVKNNISNINTQIQYLNSVLNENFSEDLDLEELDLALKNKFKTNINSLFDGTAPENILDVYVEYLDGKLKTLKEKLEETYPEIQLIRKLSNTLYEFSSNNKIYYFLKGAIDGEYEILELKPQVIIPENNITPELKSRSATLLLIVDYLVERLNIGQEDLEIINKLLVGEYGNNQFTKEAIIRKINSLLNSDIESELIEDMKNEVNSLSEVNEGKCTVPIK